MRESESLNPAYDYAMNAAAAAAGREVSDPDEALYFLDKDKQRIQHEVDEVARHKHLRVAKGLRGTIRPQNESIEIDEARRLAELNEQKRIIEVHIAALGGKI